MRDCPTLHEVLAIHAEAIRAYGGSSGMRDPGAIEAALFRPQSGYYADIIKEAAALMKNLLINHPCVDGNKRAAFASCHVFLDINGYRLDAAPQWLYDRILHWLGGKAGRFETMVRELRCCVSAR